VSADQLDRGRDLGGRRRTQHVVWCGCRCRARQLCEDLLYGRAARVLVVRARCVVRARYVVLAAGCGGLGRTSQAQAERSRKSGAGMNAAAAIRNGWQKRSEEHTSELQSREKLV